ncbi:MAG TPA: hypothetical protein VKH15_09575 [Candidatus Acidoferrum sp.]|nr:hypothetical protein [Candidatus Acidoferrum sp.]
MKLRFLTGAILVLTLLAVSPHIFRAQSSSSGSDPYLTAHEWGTFTSIAGKDGKAVQWLPLTGSTDLPSFVEHFSGVNFKSGLLGTVRMETPVLYFYTNRETTLSVHVSFSKGFITEWYPHASRVYPIVAVAPKYANFSDWNLYQKHPDGSIDWESVQVQPRNSADLPRDNTTNHYYAARQTGSSPLQIKTSTGVQTEKFLFYRGVSTFSVPVSVKINADGSVLAENLTEPQIRKVLYFERRGDKLGFRIADPSGPQVALNPPELNSDMDSLKQSVVEMLVAEGLYQDEAQAMFETWRDSWFEEGSRLLYIVPRPFVDAILPLTINPAPAQMVRVFVGRLELVTPATQSAVEQALVASDNATLNRYGRFLAPIVGVLIANEKNPTRKEQLQNYVNNFFATQVMQSAKK